MKVFLSVLSVQLMGLCVFAAPSEVIIENGGVKKWIHDLSSESFQVREKASIELWKLGDAGIPALREAVLSSDPEVSMRAKEAIDKVELKITKDTPVAILGLIDSYRKAPAKEKPNLLSELREVKAYFQLLKLYSMENLEIQGELAPVIQDVAMLAAREAVIADDVNQAIELLRMAPPNHSELMALASLYRSVGQLDQQLANLNPPQKLKQELWKGYLLRVKGDLAGAIKNAEETNQLQLLAGLRALNGDPVLWLEQNNAPGQRPETPQRAQQAYIDIALKRWHGEVVDKNDFEPLIKSLTANNRLQRSLGMASLASLGKFEMIEKIQNKDNPADAISYYLSREEIDKVLEISGLDPNKPDYSKWAKSQFDSFKDGEISEQVIKALILMAFILESRGLDKELDEAYSQPLADLLKNAPDLYWRIIPFFFNDKAGAPHFAIQHLSRWAGEDKERWRDVYSSILGEEEFEMIWLDWIREIDPKMKDEEVLESMLAIFKMSSSLGKLRETWMNRIWKIVENEKDKVVKAELVERIMKLCIQQQDVQNTLKAWDMLDEEQRATANWGSLDMYLSAANRWEDAAKILQDLPEDKTLTTAEIEAHLAATLRRGGMEDKAKIHDEMADKLALGSAASSLRIGGYYAYGGDYERANMWFDRAALEADPKDGEFLAALDKYAQKSGRSRNWKVAASCHEVIVHIYASQQYQSSWLADYAKTRMSADLARAMSILPENKEKALQTLKAIHQDFMPDGVLADDFFPALREAGLDKELNEWFMESWKLMVGVIEKYPKSHNSRNTAVWFASRAGLELAEAEKYQTEALKMAPEQAAYLDTMAELKFAQGDRKAALEWSTRSVCFAPFDDMIRLQHERFRTAPFPKN